MVKVSSGSLSFDLNRRAPQGKRSIAQDPDAGAAFEAALQKVIDEDAAKKAKGVETPQPPRFPPVRPS